MLQDLNSNSKGMKQVLSLLEAVSQTDLVVMLSGETGTGKGYIARLVHNQSLRKSQTFVTIDCASIPETLIESELFGFEKGAFTGASHLKIGKLEQAKGGTVFLDEITNISETVQKKLLRVLEERRVDRLGGTKSIPIDIRIVTAHNGDMEKALSHNQFRKDLYHRLNQIMIHIPPLRDRKEDIPTLLNRFSEEFERETGKKRKELTMGTLSLLELYNWPGNVRELKNAFRRAFLLSGGGPILAKHLPDEIRFYSKNGKNHQISPELSLDSMSGLSLKQAVRLVCARVEKAMIEKVLQDTGYKKSEAAARLGIDEKTLYNKRILYGLDKG